MMFIKFSYQGETYGVDGDEPSINTDQKGADEENLRIFGQGTLTDIHKRYGMEGLMSSYKEVAKAYNVDSEEILKWWINDVGQWQAMGLIK